MPEESKSGQYVFLPGRLFEELIHVCLVTFMAGCQALARCESLGGGYKLHMTQANLRT